jgi:hypothetical protein
MSVADNPGLLQHLLPFRRRALFLAATLPDFFPVHFHLGWSGDAQPNCLAFDREHCDRQFTVRHQDSFADFATEDEHESSSLS